MARNAKRKVRTLHHFFGNDSSLTDHLTQTRESSDDTSPDENNTAYNGKNFSLFPVNLWYFLFFFCSYVSDKYYNFKLKCMGSFVFQ